MSLGVTNIGLNAANSILAAVESLPRTLLAVDNQGLRQRDAVTTAAEDVIPKSFRWRSYLPKLQRDAYMEVVRLNATDEERKKGQDREELLDGLQEYRFIITDADMPVEEKVAVIKTFGEDPDFVATFGQDAKIWTFQGLLRNESGEGDWVGRFDYLYRNKLRASVLARERKILVFYLGDLTIRGYMLNRHMQVRHVKDDVVVDFSFRMLVRSYTPDFDATRAFAELSDAVEAGEQQFIDATNGIEPGAATPFPQGGLPA